MLWRNYKSELTIKSIHSRQNCWLSKFIIDILGGIWDIEYPVWNMCKTGYNKSQIQWGEYNNKSLTALSTHKLLA